MVHNLPIVADMHRARDDLTIDWVVEEAYADLPRLNRGVCRVIPVAQRRWRRSLSAASAEQKRVFEETLRAEEYDLVLDTQGLLKSAVLARAARVSAVGRRVGFSRRLAREGLARLFYDVGYDVDSHLHAVERIRALAGQALGYTPEGVPDFGLATDTPRPAWLGGAAYVVLLHATARPEKAWPEAHWRALARLLERQGTEVILPYGTERERRAALSLADAMGRARVAPPMRLGEAAALLAHAHAVVGIDTGLTHLAAALGTPTVALFGATPRWRYAPYWSPRAISLGDDGATPDVAAVEAALAQLGVTHGGSGA